MTDPGQTVNPQAAWHSDRPGSLPDGLPVQCEQVTILPYANCQKADLDEVLADAAGGLQICSGCTMQPQHGTLRCGLLAPRTSALHMQASERLLRYLLVWSDIACSKLEPSCLLFAVIAEHQETYESHQLASRAERQTARLKMCQGAGVADTYNTQDLLG